MNTSSTSQVTLLLKAQDETKGAFDSIIGSVDKMRASFGRLAIGNMLGDLGASAIRATVDGLKDFAGGMITANANLELMKQRLDILYQSTAEGAQAFAFLKQNELTKPFNIQDIVSASTQLVAFKQNITTMLPALEDVAGAMGQTLPVAAQAFTSAMSGRFLMMQHDLGISKSALVEFGLQMDKSGHITNPASLTSSFLALANSGEFKGGADKLAKTWTGLMSSMESQWTYFQANIGAGVFSTLEGQLHNLVSYLQTNRAAVAQFETSVGSALGSMTQGFVAFAKILITDLPPAINFVRNAFTAIAPSVAASFAAISGAIGGFVTWFRGNALPAIEVGIGTVSQWWQQHANDISRDFTFIVNTAQDFAGSVVSAVKLAWDNVTNVTKFLWDGLKLQFTLGFDLLTGNFGGFKTDFLAGVKGLAVDVIRGFGDMITGSVDVVTNLGIDLVTALVPVANKMMGPFTWFAQTFRDLFKDMGGIIGDFVGVMAKAGTDMGNLLLVPINDAIKAIAGAGQWLDKIPGMSHVVGGLAGFKPLTLGDGTGNADSAKKGITGWFDSHAPGLNAGQHYTGMSIAQAQKDLQANAKKITDPFNSFMNGIIDDMISVVDPKGTNGSKAKVSAQTAGANLISSVFDDLFGANGALSNLTKSTNSSKVTAAAIGNAAAFNLPVLGAFSSPATSAVSAAGGAVGASHIPTGRVPLGALGATFMQTIATTGKLGGADPATRAAQQQVDGQQTQIKQGDKQTQLLTVVAEAQSQIVDRLEDVARSLARMLGPHAVPGNPLQSRGVGRPIF